ncbi:hypothetical protein LTR36_005516 [Oleoguttula mirabilis]|uniref:EGF-like domain-containing protein n=1 Tax=Oleoguttula mirabilis TaxID=1507867 RepID=A0AAV9JFT3_9PEZI|nr:hypothetical protein LTR36_005516 [Oleoguttula mirabilis]
MPPPQGRRPPPPGAGYGPQRGQPPMRPDRPAGPPNGGRFPVRPQHQQYAQPRPPPPPPPPQHSTENLYDGSEYGEPEYEQSDQWPLPARPFVQPQPRTNSPSNSARRPPQRPQRPDAPQPLQDLPRARVAPANQQYHPPPPPPPPPSHHGSGQWTGDGYSAPPGDYAPPNHPVPHAPSQQSPFMQAVKRPPLGPPPSARRGPASYYPQIAPVHPIAEEADSVRGSIRNPSVFTGHDSMKSYASSNAIPIGIPDYYLEQRDSMPSLPGAERPVSGPDSEYSHHDSYYASVMPAGARDYELDDRDELSPEPATVMRQASVGRKSKPTLTTVKSSEKVRRGSAAEGQSTLPSQQRSVVPSQDPMPAMAKEADIPHEPKLSSESDADSYDDAYNEKFGHSDKDLEAGGAAALAAATVAAPTYAEANRSRDILSNRTPGSDVLRSGTGLIDPSSSESENEGRKKSSRELLGASFPKVHQQRSREPSPLSREVDPRMAEILGQLEKGGALTPTESEKLKVPTGGLSERAGKRRPPRLQIDAVREAEARGSLTSLPDLIKRATRLASNLDRGKTASRLGMNWFDGAGDGDGEKRRSGSISDILASFPPPGLATPPGSRAEMRRSATGWSSRLRHSHLPSDSDAGEVRGRRRKRCCGLPLWLFILLLLLLILLVAAAVVVPVVLVVIPHQNDIGKSTSDSALSACQAKLTCQNGGANIITSAGSCQCLCVNGYTGSLCGTASSAGCTTTSVGSTDDATVGSAIPRLLSGSQSNFSVPLDGQTLLGLFSGADLSCSSENALVTFNNNAGAKRDLLDVAAGPTPTMRKRETATATSSGQDGAVTSNGIVFETGTPTAGSGSASSTSTSTSASASASSTASSSSSGSTSDSTSLDFARVAVLYILQASGQLTDAETAQENLQSYFTSGETSSGQTINPANVSLGNGFTCDLSGHSINLSNGTTVGQ